MKQRHHANELERKRDDPVSPATENGRKRRGSIWRTLGILLLVLVVLGIVARVMMPSFLRDYVNRTLDRSQLYAGTIGEIDVHLWRGAYSIHDIRISKRIGDVPVPFFTGERVDFALQWNALWHRRVVGRVFMLRPELNFVDGPTEEEKQTGGGGAWLQIIQDLFPFKINSAVVQDGSVHFRAFNKEKPVDVYLSEVNGAIDNLGNIRSETKPLVATVDATGLVMDQAKMEFKMTFDPFAYRPTFQLATRMLGLDLTQLNNLARSYGQFDFEKGWLDLVVETTSNEGRFTGYVKPMFRDAKIFSLTQDIKDENIFELFWQALVGGVTTIFKNWQRDQFATVIPFEGDATGSKTDVLATIGNILRNAFVRAYLPRLESGAGEVDGLRFQPPQVSDPISPAETL